MDEKHDDAPQGEPIIESASATTSPDNARSGHAAYVIFGVAVALLLALCAGLSSCATSISDVALRNVGVYGQGYGFGRDTDRGYEPEDLLDEILDEVDLVEHHTYGYLG